MIIRYNSKFQDIVGENFNIEGARPYPYNFFTNREEIIEIEGCYYFKRFAHEGKISERLNRMEYEFDTNKIRIDDLIKDKISAIDSFWCGLSMVRDLIKKLQVNFGNGFEIILSYNYEHCFIRFYKIRKGVNNVMSTNLEDFKYEAILRVVI